MELDQVLREAFRTEAAEHCPLLRSSLEQLPSCAGPDQASELLSRAFRSAHTLKGSARAIDFPEAEAVAAALEEKLRAAATPELGQFSDLDRLALLGAVDLLAACCQAHADGQRLPASKKIREALKAIEQAQPEARAGQTPASEQDLESMLREAFLSESRQNLEQLSAGLRDFAGARLPDARLAAARQLFTVAHSLKGSARAVTLPDVEALCQVLEEKWRGASEDSLSCSFSAADLACLEQAGRRVEECVLAFASGTRPPSASQTTELIHRLEDVRPGSGSVLEPEPQAEPAGDLEATLRTSFCSEAAENLASLMSALTEFQSANTLEGRVQAAGTAFRAAHSLKGSARVVEEPDMEALSSALEERWRPATEPEQASFDPAQLLVLDQARQLLEQCVEAYRLGLRGPKARQVKLMLTQLDTVQAGSGTAPEAPVAQADQSLEQLLLDTFAEEVGAHLPILRQCLTEMTVEQSGPRRESLGRFYLAASALKGAARAMDTPDIEALCDALEQVARAAEQSEHCLLAASDLHSLDQALAVVEACSQAFLGGRRGPGPDEIKQQVARLEQLAETAGQAQTVQPDIAADQARPPEQVLELDPELVAMFRTEASDYLDQLNQALLGLEQGDQQQLEVIFRDVHSLKGAARSVNLGQLEALCHPLESLLAALKRGQLANSPDIVGSIGKALRGIESMLSADPSGQLSQVQLEQLQQELEGRVQGIAPTGAPVAPLVTSLAPSVSLGDSVRVPSVKLDAMLMQAEEMLSLKLSSTQSMQDLRSLRHQFTEWNRQWKRFAGDALALRREAEEQGSEEASPLLGFLDWNLQFMRSLELRVEELSRAATQNQRAVSGGVDQLLEDSKSLLLFPFSSILQRYPQLVRDLARDLGKQVALEISGQETEVDRRILESIKDPLLHLVRNSLDHGLESPEQRRAQGKSGAARLEIRVRQQYGDRVEIVVRDDGAGIDPERLRAAAVRKGTLTGEAAQSLSDSEAIALIFQSDFSTRQEVSSISGRGLGMAIVKDQIKRLGGSMTVESEVGAGTTFTILLPLTLANYRAVLVGYAEQQILIPALSVHRILRVPAASLVVEGATSWLELEGERIRVARLAQLLAVPESPDKACEDSLLVVVLESNREHLGVVVDLLHGEHEVLARAFAPPLDRIPFLAGASVLGSGRVAPILRVSQLLESMDGHQTGIVSRPRAQPQAAAPKRVLLADDSLTSRTLLKNVLEGAGLEVVAVADGAAAWEQLRTQPGRFDLVVSDVEMPRMSGLELARSARADGRFEHLPIVMVTTLDSPEDRKRGMAAGATAYIPKGSLRANALLETVRQFV